MQWYFRETMTMVTSLLFASLASQWCQTCSATTLLGDPIALSTLAGNSQGSIVAGDKLFTNFNYSSTGDIPAGAAVNVVPIRDDNGNFGIRFQGSFTDLSSTPGGSDASITYKVLVTDQRFIITDAHLVGDPIFSGSSGTIDVTQSFQPLSPIMNIYADQAHPQPKTVDAVLINPPMSMLNVQTDIFAFAVGASMVTLSHIDQAFSQGLSGLNGVLGDYNHNNIVDAADYVVWRKGTATQTDYNLWRENFGQSTGSSADGISTTAVPESTTLVLVLVGTLALLSQRCVTVS